MEQSSKLLEKNLKYPIYVISKGRYERCLTANFLVADNIPFHLVVEPQEADEYIKRYGADRVYILPFSNLGLGSIPARNWVWEHAKSHGHFRHWILDDNISGVKHVYRGKRIYCHSAYAFETVEEFVDRYENIAIAGLDYDEFGIKVTKPYKLNVHVYSWLLIRNDLPYRWRGRYNEDTDLCLQCLKGGWTTVLFSVFLSLKAATMTMKGGNTDELYKGDGRLQMAYSLKKQHPSHVKVAWRFKRWQHVVNWGVFKQPLIRRKDIDWNALKERKYGMRLVAKKEVKSNNLKKIMATANG